MNTENTLFDFDDILLEATIMSDINHRAEIDCMIDGMLPIFTAPMFDVIGLENFKLFEDLKINTIIPRSKFDLYMLEKISQRCGWVAVSLEEMQDLYDNDTPDPSISKNGQIKILIDIANGHMQRLYDLSVGIKERYGDSVQLMIGNIANPVTYAKYARVVDFVRVGVGNGSACLTTQQTAVGYPMASLIANCKAEKNKLEENGIKAAAIVADGGMQKYSDIIKAIALGADYVMLGSILNKALESSADTFIGNKKYESWTEPGDKIDQYDPMYAAMLKSGTKFYKKYRGMSTKEIQKEIKSSGKLKTSEGIIKLQQVEYTLSQWTENFRDYLRSTMSYCGARNLDEFRKEVTYNFITQNSLNRFKK